ncbi:hypothetical protein OZX67_00325 [Bifidobacterium sp. ESL0728]|uniref:hypothetical protein n=1 Tax=Bifidobacterium sp. ESL0728 TaxID=2983220 RepID=UPI0023F7FED3|nr:hypothetical protein [Bifidobacterium sp. ESL0728]WEV59066.1 hypothetical protein OZX67_00325 [Bifidobacterium sp. ESL0728]
MKPQLGDIVISRYTLVSPLRSIPGLEAWKANDRILARDCQLFIVTDKAAIPSFEAIASTLTLSRNPHFTQVIQMQHVGEIPVLITRLDQGLSLNNFIGHGSRRLGYEAMRSIIAEAADGMETLLRDDLKMKALSTDIVRITSKGVQIADAPLEAMFVSNPKTQHLQPEMLAVNELALLLYAMLTGEWTSEIKDFDLSAIPEDTPEELRIICERGLPITDVDGSPTLSMVSLAELVALLGAVKPLAELPPSEVRRPNSDGEASVLRLAVRRARPGNLLDFPQNLSTNQLQFRARQAASAAESAAAKGAATAAGAGALANAAQKQTGAAASNAGASRASAVPAAAAGRPGAKPVKAGSPNQTKASGRAGVAGTANANPASGNTASRNAATASKTASSQHGTAPSPNKRTAPGASTASALPMPSGAAAANNAKGNPAGAQGTNPGEPAQDKSSKWWRQRGKSGSNQPKPSDDLTNAAAPRMDLHDLAAAEMADAFKSFDSTADDSIFPDFDQNTVQTTNPTMQFDFAMKGNPAAPHDTTPGNRTEATGRIPLLDANGNFIEPGHESAQALQAEQEAIDAANPVITPPSFTPQQQTQQQSANPTGDDIADTPLLGKLTTKVVAIIAVIVLILAAAGVAAYVLTDHNNKGNGSYQQSSSDPWPNMNLNKVPFGAQGNGANSEDQGSGNSGNSDTSGKQNGGSSTDSSNGASGGSSSKSEAGSGSGSKLITADKIANAVPAPSIPVNNTPLTIDKQEFYRQPAGQNGLAYYMHVSQPADVTRFVVQIRTSGGTGYLIANTTQDPNAGQQVAQFTFDQSGTTEVKLQKPVKSQDFLLWVPMDSLPNHSLYINHVQLF